MEEAEMATTTETTGIIGRTEITEKTETTETTTVTTEEVTVATTREAAGDSKKTDTKRRRPRAAHTVRVVESREVNAIASQPTRTLKEKSLRLTTRRWANNSRKASRSMLLLAKRRLMKKLKKKRPLITKSLTFLSTIGSKMRTARVLPSFSSIC
jgi:hypothetical protein